MNLEDFFQEYTQEPSTTTDDKKDAAEAEEMRASKPQNQQLEPEEKQDSQLPQPLPGTHAASSSAQTYMSPEAEEVNKIVNSNAVMVLSRPGQMNQESRETCAQVFGYAPLDLFDQQNQVQLFRQDPRLEDALTFTLTRSFAVGINRASDSVSRSIILISVARALLDKTISAMRHGTESRTTLVQMSSDIQKSMEIISHKAHEFVILMAKMTREMGETAAFLEFQANATTLLEALAKMNMNATNETNDLQEEETAILRRIEEAMTTITGNLQNCDGFSRQEKKVKDLRDAYDEKERELVQGYQAQYTEQTNLITRDKFLEMEIENLENEKKVKEGNCTEQQEEVDEMRKRKKQLELKRDAIRDAPFDPSRVDGLEDIDDLVMKLKNKEIDTTNLTNLDRGKVDIRELQAQATTVTKPAGPSMFDRIKSAFRKDFQQMVDTEIKGRQSVMDSRIRRLEKQEKGIETQAFNLREQSKVASDGFTTVTTSSVSVWDPITSRTSKNTICNICNSVCHTNCGANARSGCMVMTNHMCDRCHHSEYRHVLGVSTPTTTSKQTGSNERARLQQMASEVENSLNGIRDELRRLRDERAQIPRQVLSEMQAKQQARDANAQSEAAQAQEQARLVDEQKRMALESAMQMNADIERQNLALLETMEAKNDEIRAANQQIVDAALQRNAGRREKAREAFFAEKSATLDMVNQQINTIQVMMDTVTKRKTDYENATKEIQQKTTQYQQERLAIERELAAFTERRAGKMAALERLEEAQETAKTEYEAARDQLQEMVRRYGVETGEEFAAFMEVFQLLNKSVQNLPLALRELSQAFEAAEQTLSGDVFEKALNAVPEDRRGKALERIAVNYQAICEIGWGMFKDPINNLIQSDTAAVLRPLVAANQRALTQGTQVDVEDAPPGMITEITEDESALGHSGAQ